MKSILVTYPNFQSLAKGIKRMLVTSESFFFGDANSAPVGGKAAARTAGNALKESNDRWQRQPLEKQSALWRN